MKTWGLKKLSLAKHKSGFEFKTQQLKAGMENFLCKGPDGEDFRLQVS